MRHRVIVDTSCLVALASPKDPGHKRATQFAETTSSELIIPEVVLPEAMYNVYRRAGMRAALRFGNSLIERAAPFLSLTPDDFARAMEIMAICINTELDFVDCCITALAERLDINAVCTFDRRDFSIIRPKHIEYFELLL